MPQPKVILFLTGIPGTGKTTSAAFLEKFCQARGLSIRFIDDRPLLRQWAELHRFHPEKVSWHPQPDGSERFSISLASYPELSEWVSTAIATEIQQNGSEAQIIVVESARGAGLDGQRDRYDQHLFAPFMQHLKDQVLFVNIEMVVDDYGMLRERVNQRIKENPAAAPPFVLEKYISDVEGIQSAVAQAMEFADNFILNTEINNSGDEVQTQFQLEGIIVQALAYLSTMEGVIKAERHHSLHNHERD